MLMNFSSKRRAGHATAVSFAGRRGHRAARINDSIFVLGGSDKAGRFVNEVHRINCLNNKIDTLILENTTSVEGFSLFAHQDALFLWGGLRLHEHVNLLLQFDGTKFSPVKQHGSLPAPRAYHASVTFGGKFLILFGGSDGDSFFNDWNLLNLKTMEWRRLKPSLEISSNLHSSMVWTNGRGILLVNELYQQSSTSFLPNSFYEFYVNDFNQGLLRVLPLELTLANSPFQDFIFNHLTVSDHNSLLIFGGYLRKDPTQMHGLAFTLSLDSLRLERSKIRYREKSQFQSIYHKNKLYIIGGVLGKDEMEDFVQIYESSSERHNYKRHVCNTCKLYFDQEWVRSSKEAFPHSRIKEEYDYNYHLKVDNRVLAKLSTYITTELYALSLIIQTLKQLSSTQIFITFHKTKHSFSSLVPEMPDGVHHFLKIACNLPAVDFNALVNELLMRKEREESVEAAGVQGQVLRLKLASLRMGQTCLMSVRVSRDEVCIIYFSCLQLECTFTNYHPFTNYHYYYNSKTKEYSSKNNRHIIHENVKHIISNMAHFEEIGEHSFSMIVFCGEEIENELVSFEHNEDVETGETYPAWFNAKEENRKTVPLMQFSFLPTNSIPSVFIEQMPVSFINIIDLLRGDSNSTILQRIDRYDQLLPSDIFQQIQLFYYPSEYWFRRILIYHSNRLVSHFQEGSLGVCGVVLLKETVELDLTGNRICNLAVEEKVKNVVNDFKTLKRPAPF